MIEVWPWRGFCSGQSQMSEGWQKGETEDTVAQAGVCSTYGGC